MATCGSKRARSFQQALRLDPQLALAHWGLSRTWSGLDDHDAAVTAARRAQELAKNATPREQRRIALRLQQLDAIADLATKRDMQPYKQAIDKALVADFDDVELWLIRGNAEEPTAAGRGQRGFAASVGVLSTGAEGGAGQRRGQSLSHPLVRKPQPDRRRA